MFNRLDTEKGGLHNEIEILSSLIVRDGSAMDKNDLIQALAKIVGQENVLASETDLAVYGYDGSLHSGLPEVIVLPKATEQVSAIVSLASKEGIPIVARGSGTNLSGGSIPLKGGIVIHFFRNIQIL